MADRHSVSVLCLFLAAGFTSSVAFQQEYEWVQYGQLPQYAQDSSFSVLAFTVPPHTEKAEFHVKMTYGTDSRDGDNNKVLLSLRRTGIPVLQTYNESTPDSFILPSDQQTYETKNKTKVILTLTSPTPGRVYLVASELNPLEDIISYLRWGQELKGGLLMNVTAIYSVRISVMSLPIDDVRRISSKEGLTQIYSFRLPAFTTTYSINISNCQHNTSNTGCPLTMMTADSLAANDNSSVKVDCHQQGLQCLLTVPSPLLEHEHYVTFSFNDTASAQNTTFSVSFDVKGCTEAVQYHVWNGRAKKAAFFGDPVAMFDQGSFSYKHTAFSNHPPRSVSSAMYRNMTGALQFKPGSVIQNPACINLGFLGRDSKPISEESFSYNIEFGMWTSEGKVIPDFNVIVPDFSTEIRTFSLQNSLDSGGTLYIMAQLQTTDWQGIVWLCLSAHRIAMNGSVNKCTDGVLLSLNATTLNDSKADGAGDNVSSHAYVPFPTTGSWYMAMQSQCWGARGPEACELLPMVQLSIRITRCAPNMCGRYGHCAWYTDANIIFAGCNCYAGYRGLSCDDGTYSLTDAEQLRAVYLLTLSNLAFLPAICLALYRRYFTLAAIFFFNAFFSAFYHACDASHVFQLCIVDYSTLAFCDFFGSILSFYAVLLTMSKIQEGLRTFLLVSGALVIAVLQNSDRHSDLAHILPLAVAGCILIVSWALVMRRQRKLYPSRGRYLCFLLPGVVLAVTGIGVNYGLMWHKSTYQYTHSFWHVSLMIAPCFLMPPRSKGLSVSSNGLSISAQDIIRSGRQQPPEQIQQEDDDEPAMFDASMNSINSGRNLLI